MNEQAAVAFITKGLREQREGKGIVSESNNKQYLVSFTVHNGNWIIDDGVWSVEASSERKAKSEARWQLEERYGLKAVVRIDSVELNEVKS